MRYDDGEIEDLPLRELQSMLLRDGIRAPAPAAGGGALLPGYEAYGDDATVADVLARLDARRRPAAGGPAAAQAQAQAQAPAPAGE